MKKGKLNNVLIGTLAVVLAINVVVMAIYTVTTNAKLAEAIELAKPQAGTLTLVAAEECPQCKSLDPMRKFIENQNVELTAEETLLFGSDEATAIIEEYSLERLPVLIFESETKIKAPLKKTIEGGSREIGDNILIWEQPGAPYFDIETASTKGLVEVTYIVDKSCDDCYDPVKIHKGVLNKFGVVAVQEETVDVGEDRGKELVKKYDIMAVPTVMLSKEADVYKALKAIWDQIGSIEEDGSFVFREMTAIKQTYKNPQTGKINHF